MPVPIAAQIAALSAQNMSNFVGLMTNKQVMRTAKHTTKMFKAMKGTAMHAKVMSDLFAIIDAFLIVVKPFLPFLKILAAIIKSFLAPAVIELTELLTPLYSGFSALIPEARALGSAVGFLAFGMTGLLYILLDIGGGPVQFLAVSLQMLGDTFNLISVGALWYFNSQLYGLNITITTLTTGSLLLFNDTLIILGGAIETVSGWLSEIYELFKKLANINIGGIGRPPGVGGGGGSPAFGGLPGFGGFPGFGGGGISIPGIGGGSKKKGGFHLFQGGGIADRPVAGIVEKNEAVMPLDELYGQFADLKQSMDTNNFLLADLIKYFKTKSEW